MLVRWSSARPDPSVTVTNAHSNRYLSREVATRLPSTPSVARWDDGRATDQPRTARTPGARVRDGVGLLARRAGLGAVDRDRARRRRPGHRRVGAVEEHDRATRSGPTPSREGDRDRVRRPDRDLDRRCLGPRETGVIGSVGTFSPLGIHIITAVAAIAVGAVHV